ncbi:MAG: hypothetical protein JWL59_3444 [Chthoniobacteraceae bacterium]|nr:hypothetical protein [Chthoniobacteraceae bacterium]
MSIRILFLVFAVCGLGVCARAATFSDKASDTVRIEIADTNGDLSWKTSANAFTVMAWVKISIPSGTLLSENMTILANRKTGDWTQPHAWRFYFNISTGNLEFSAQGTAALAPIVLVERPYLDRWYHLAVVRSGTSYTPYVDGRALTPSPQNIGTTATTDGVSIGGFKGKEKFWGEVQEVSIFQTVLSAASVNLNRLRDIPPALAGLKGYYKLGYSTLASDNLKNFAATPPTGTDPAVTAGTGTITYPETDKQGEQSLFDSQKNQGRDAMAPLGGGFTWQRTLFSRATAGLPFEFRVGYNSGIAYNCQALEGGTNMFEADAVLGSGWRHSFQTRLIPGSTFLVGSGGYIGLLLWDGSLETWQRQSGQYKPTHGEYRGELADDPATADYMIWITPDRTIYRFYHPSNTADPLLAGKLKEIRDFNGNVVTLSYEPNQGLLDTVTDTAGTAWKFYYNAQNQLTSVTALGWTATFTYNAENRLSTFFHAGPADYTSTPPLSTTWTAVHGGPNSLLSQMTNPRGIADVTVVYDKYGRKTTEADGSGRATSYQYGIPASRQITRTDGDGFKWMEGFDRKGHVVSRADPLGNTFLYEFYSAGDKDAFGSAIPIVGVMKRQTEPLGSITTFDAYDERANLLQKTDALGNVWRWVYAKPTDALGANGRLTDPAGLAALLNRPLKDIRPRVTGEVADWENRYIYDSHANLLSQEDNLGLLTTYAYDSRGLVKTSRDANYSADNLSITKFFYFQDTGFLQSKTDATNQSTTFTYTELGWLKSTTDPLQNTFSSEFDINGHVVRTNAPLGRTTTATYDEVGNARFATDAKLQQSESQYDGSNLRVWAKDRAGSVATSTYNNRSLAASGTSPLVPISQVTGAPQLQNITTSRTYDEAGRLLREFDPNGNYTEHSYDANGNEVTTRDRLGRLSRRQYDRLNRATVEIDPLGNTCTSSYDESGRLLSVTNPKGATSRNEYDGRGRLKKWTDPMGQAWIYQYDGVGNILDIEDALHGHYVMTYDVRGLRLTEKNQDQLVWTYTYDELGRLKTEVEPTGITRTLYYDAAGRLFYAQFSTGRQSLLSYDNNDNVLSVTRIDGQTGQSTATNLGYDVLDRPYSSTDAFGQTVGYAYDALGRLTTLTYPGNRPLSQEFDNLGRLVRQSTAANWGGHVLTYQWDKEGRLTSQTYPNGISRTATYDELGRQTALGYTDGKGTPATADDSVLIALNYAYDRNGNQTSAREKGLLSYPFPAVHDETSVYTAAGRLKTRSDAADSTGAKNWTYEFKKADGSESFNLSKATCPIIGSLSLTYDEDNRTTKLLFDPPATTPPGQVPALKAQVLNRYDALGRRISRTLTTGTGATAATTETRYVLSLTGGMERILADTTSTNQITALYLHGPDLAVKVDPADPAKITCYHADCSGNIVRLTDKDRAATAEYAYSDYGRPYTAFTTADSNSYRFVGSQGVMEEPLIPGLYFMRARYYLADAGVFLSVDPVKNIGPGWKPEAYGYGNENPSRYSDVDGQFAQAVIFSSIAVIGTTAKMNYDMLTFLATDGVAGRSYSVSQVIGNSVGAAASGALSSLAAPLALEGFAAFAANGLAGYAGVAVARGLTSGLGGENEQSLAEDIVDSLGESVIGVGIETGTVGIRGRVGLKTWNTKAFAHAAYNTEKAVAGGIAMSTVSTIRGITSSYSTASAGKIAQSTSLTNSTIKSGPSISVQTTTLPTIGASTYTIRAGDTLSSIAARYGTTVATLASTNGISNPNLIQAGGSLKISTGSGGSSATKPGSAASTGATTKSGATKSK